MPQHFKWKTQGDGTEINATHQDIIDKTSCYKRVENAYCMMGHNQQPELQFCGIQWQMAMAKILSQYLRHSSSAASGVCLSMHDLWVVLWTLCEFGTCCRSSWKRSRSHINSFSWLCVSCTCTFGHRLSGFASKLICGCVRLSGLF